MSKKRNTENAKYRAVIKKYRKHFGLTQGDVAALLVIEENKYNGIESGKRTLDIDTADDIAKVYGFTYFEIGNPDQNLPLVESLPVATREKIKERKSSGIKLKNTERNLGHYLDVLIKKGKLDQRQTSKEIWKLLPKKTREMCGPTDITNLLIRAPRNKFVKNAGKIGKEIQFQLISL